MSFLYNKICKKELKNRILNDKIPRLTLSFYKYFTIDSPEEYRNKIYRNFCTYSVLGRIYVAKEGINAQISVPIKNYFLLKQFLYQLHSKLHNIRMNQSLNNKQSFWVLSVKVRKKIVEDGIIDPLFEFNNVGIYVKSRQVNLMLSDKNTIFIDMRNSYEYAIGHFPEAIEIKSLTFREQLKNVISLMKHAKNKKIVMYCTGGIRCEKATSWMIFNGFKHVYHIEGGIIGYVHDAKKNNLPILFKGKNFVFDHRMSESVSNDIISSCFQCNTSEDTYVNCKNDMCHLLFIQCKNCANFFNHCCSLNCMNKISTLLD